MSTLPHGGLTGSQNIYNWLKNDGVQTIIHRKAHVFFVIICAYSVNNSFMTKKEYIDKLSNLIVNRVRFHAPVVYDGEIDFDILEIVGIDTSLPIFKIETPLDKMLAASFIKAQKEVNFNIISTRAPKISKSQRSQLKNFIYISEEELGLRLLTTINALNINYKSSTQFDKNIEEDYIKLNDEIINLNYREFYLEKKSSSDGVMYDIKEYLLNGKNYLLSLSNLTSEKKVTTFEINIILPRGYYYFKREGYAVKIVDLYSQDSAYFNFNCKNAKVTFSSISGIESSTHACINMKLNIALAAKEQKRFYFNYGENKYYFTHFRDAEEFFAISQKKMKEIFNFRVLSRDKAFDDKFNRVLPQKIWLKWLNFDTDYESEEEYLKMKESIAKKSPNGYQINESNKDIKQIQIYDGTSYKRIFIVPGESRYLLAGGAKYYNFNCVRPELFAKSSEIYLSFGAG